MKRILIKGFAAFVPNKKLRHKLRQNLKSQNNQAVTKGEIKLIDTKENDFSHDKEFVRIAGLKFRNEGGILHGLAEMFGRMDYEFGGLGKKSVFIDVGANIGDSALYAAQRKDVEKVYAFEPFPGALDLARENIKLNQAQAKKINLFDYGWSDKDETVEIAETSNIGDSAINTTETFFSEKAEIRREKMISIKLRRSSAVLKDILKNTKQPIVLKIDIEGSEYKCLEELDKANLIGKIDVFFIEWHYRGYKRLTDILEKNGFVWFNEKFRPEIGFIRACNTKKKK